MPANRSASGKFIPNHSGNPLGRPKLTDPQREAIEILRASSPAAAAKLVKLMDCGDFKVELAAARAIADKAIPDIAPQAIERADRILALDDERLDALLGAPDAPRASDS